MEEYLYVEWWTSAAAKPGHGTAGGAQNQPADYMRQQRASRVESLQDSANTMGQSINDIEASGTELTNSYEAEMRQADAEMAKIDGACRQLAYAQQKHDELIRKAMSQGSVAAQTRFYLWMEIDRWLRNWKSYICDKVASACEESMFRYMQACDNRHAKEAGVQGTGSASSGRPVGTQPGDVPSDAYARQQDDLANKLYEECNESQISLNAQTDQIQSSREQIEGQCDNLARKYEDQQESIADKARRAEARLAEINESIDKAGSMPEAGAATMVNT